MVTCQNCNSKDVRVNNGNFAKTKREGEPSAVHVYNKFFFYCEQCGSQWESTEEAERDYLDYVWLRNRTTIVARDLKGNGGYGPAQYINPDELLQRGELAKKIINSHQHLLDLDPSEWYEIRQDASLGA